MDVFFVLGAVAHNRIGLVPLCLFIAKGQTFLCLGWGAAGSVFRSWLLPVPSSFFQPRHSGAGVCAGLFALFMDGPFFSFVTVNDRMSTVYD